MRRWVIYGTGVVLPEWGVGCQAARTVLCGGRAMKRASLPLRRALGELAAMQRCLLRVKSTHYRASRVRVAGCDRSRWGKRQSIGHRPHRAARFRVCDRRPHGLIQLDQVRPSRAGAITSAKRTSCPTPTRFYSMHSIATVARGASRKSLVFGFMAAG
jgi:hypothetical protein